MASEWVHSRYVRQLADATVGGRPVRIELGVRRLYCENPTCAKVTFAEQVPGLTVRYQRRTPLLQQLVEAVGVVLAGRGGARMLSILNIALSRSTVLSQLMRVPFPPLTVTACPPRSPRLRPPGPSPPKQGKPMPGRLRVRLAGTRGGCSKPCTH